MVFVNHGDAEVCESYAKCLSEEHGFTVSVPYSGAEFDLLKNAYISMPDGIAIEKRKAKQRRSDSAYSALTAAGERLMAVIRGCQGIPNKELGRFTAQINTLITRWESRVTKKK